MRNPELELAIGEEKKGEKAEGDETDASKKPSSSGGGGGFLSSLKGVFSRAKASASKDVEAGEKKELLDDEEDDNEDEANKKANEGDEDSVKVDGDKNEDDEDDAEKGALVESPGKKSQVRN